MKKLLCIILCLVCCVGLLAGCGGPDSAEVLNIYNWGLYMDPEVLTAFTEETGIEVEYEEFTANEDMYTRLSQGTGNYDLIFPSDYMIERLINEGMLNELNYANIPNLANIDPSVLNLSFDPEQKYSVPFTWGTVGIVYNTDHIKLAEEEVDWDILFDPQYEKQILMSDSYRDTIGVALQHLGYSQNSRDPQELEAAKQLLIEQKPLVLAYVVDEVRDLMPAEEAWVAMVWSGEGMYLDLEYDNLKFVTPRSGCNLFVDAACVPTTAENQDYAEQFINFLCRPDVAAKNAEYIGYSTPVLAAHDLLDQEWINNFNAYPDAEFIATKTEMFRDPSDFLREYERIWTEIFAS